MPLPPNSTGENSRWWSDWHLSHAAGGTLEQAFLGRLLTRGLEPFARSKAQLDADWSEFQTWWGMPLPQT